MLILEEVELQLKAIEGKTGVGIWPGISKSNNFYDSAASQSFLRQEKLAIQYLDSGIVQGNDSLGDLSRIRCLKISENGVRFKS